MYEKAVELINNFFLIRPPEDNCGQVFEILKEIINFDCAYIYYMNEPVSGRPEYSYNPQKNPGKWSLSEELKIKNTRFGQIIITRQSKFNSDEAKIFKTCAGVISNILKDIEITGILNMQVNALQKGFRKVLDAEKVKNGFLANISHELRTPLNAIIGFSELLDGDFAGALNPKQKEYVNDIRVSGLHLLGMINGILDMSKLEAHAMKLNPSSFSLKQSVNEILNIINPLAQKKNIKTLSKMKDFEIYADYQKIHQILFNLASNAVKFSDEGGTVKITAEKNADNITISVIDNGIGIDKKHHSKIFKKFEQLGSNTNSTGLGLTITKELVKLHNGTINVKSEPGKGSAFTVTLPNQLKG
ncbi:MAG: HAMP domain-containing histidine kinase [Heliobacteriaceae bacterium]|jgi:signal transduction histidine kinase|nr:HAMP domain-containing histidine kinase [Heliobacteriaceae bacterium]